MPTAAHRRVNAAALALLAVAAATVWSVMHAGDRDSAAAVHATARARATDPPPHTPVRIDIPAAGVHAVVLDLGLKDDGTPQTPDGEQGGYAGWYDRSAAPGEAGAAVIVGRGGTRRGRPAVFHGLRALRRHDLIVITRQDGSRARFVVIRVRARSAADAFRLPAPRRQAPGSRTPGSPAPGSPGHLRPSLRLVSCAGLVVDALPG